MNNPLIKFITSTDNARRNDIINEINESQSQDELTRKGKKICDFLETTKDKDVDILIRDVYQTKTDLLRKK